MNDKSTITFEDQTSLHLHSFQIHCWFVAKDGKGTSPVEKLLDTPAHKQERKECIQKCYDVLVYKEISMVDKKRFYVISRRKK